MKKKTLNERKENKDVYLQAKRSNVLNALG
jgi:hypothetical protein